jgi:hypothetical protein
MQYWILYTAGVGGDGFANLLEHSSNIKPADGKLYWRIHRRIAEQVKFYGCHWTLDPDKPFRKNYPILNVTLNPIYLRLVENKINTVIAAHYVYWMQIDRHPLKDIIQKDQSLINLYSTKYQRTQRDYLVKHLMPIQDELYPLEDIIMQTQDELKRPYDVYIDIDRAWQDWNYLDDKLKTLDIHLDKCYYDEYLKIKGP